MNADARGGTPQGLISNLRTVLTLVPYRMTGKLLLLTAASFVAAVMDLVAVVMMLPLMQVLTGRQASSGVIQHVVIPLIGTRDRQALLLAIAFFVGAAFVAKNGALILIRWWSLGVTNRAMAESQAEMLQRYVSAEYWSHLRRSKAEILQVITGSVPLAFLQVLLGYIQVVADGLTVAVLGAALVAMAPEASLLALIVFGGSALVIARGFRSHAQRLGRASLKLGEKSWGSLGPAIEGFRETRLFRRESLFTEQFRQNRLAFARVNRLQSLFGEMPKYILEVVMIFGIMVIALVLFATRPEATAFGLLAVFTAAAMRMVPALNRMVATVNGIRAGAPHVMRVADQVRTLDAEKVAGSTKGGSALKPSEGDQPPIVGDIIVDRVSYRYPDGMDDVVSDLSTTIPYGSTIALIGASGAGKSTFADLLVGLLAPTAGHITVGGRDITIERDDWLASVAMVSQKVYLWDASLRDLITFGQPRETVDERRLAEVLDLSQLRDLVATMPHGLDQWVGEGGARISGGQAQRIGIARALYANPRYLVLDEATSALDNETEHEITATIDALRGKITVVVIAHRLSTVRNADHVLLFARGRLADQGTFSELRSKNPLVARLAELGSLE